MLQAFSMVDAAPSSLPDSVKDDDPPECPTEKIIELKYYLTAQDKNPNELVCFPITVDDSLSTEAQNIVKRSCGDSVSSLEVEPLLRKHQSKIWISMKAAAYSIALHAIILGLPSAELGPVVHISAVLHG